MNIIETKIHGLLIIEPKVFSDERGWFMESFNEQKFAEALTERGLPVPKFVQDNHSMSKKGVLRGLHFQLPPHAQGKLVRVVTGAVYDVAVDLRPDSPTFGMSYGVVLSGENKRQLWVPRGFAHGYLVLEDDTIFSYKCDNYYHKPAENGIRYDDPELSISWPSVDRPLVVSDKDLSLGSLTGLLL